MGEKYNPDFNFEPKDNTLKDILCENCYHQEECRGDLMCEIYTKIANEFL